MEELEATFPGIGIFLKDVLAKENLSPLAEKMRSHYVMKIQETTLDVKQPDDLILRRKASERKDCRSLNLDISTKNNEKRASQCQIKELSENRDMPKNDSFIQRVDFVGILYKRKKLAWKKLNCLITGTIFTYFDFDSEPHSGGKEIDITGCSVCLATKEGLKYPEEIKLTSSNRKSYVFYAETQDASINWMQEFQKHAEQTINAHRSRETLDSNSNISNPRNSNCYLEMNECGKKKSKKRYKIQSFMNMVREKMAPDPLANGSHIGALYDEIHIMPPSLPRSPPPLTPCTYETLNFVENSYMDPVDCIDSINHIKNQKFAETNSTAKNSTKTTLNLNLLDKSSFDDSKNVYSEVADSNRKDKTPANTRNQLKTNTEISDPSKRVDNKTKGSNQTQSNKKHVISNDKRTSVKATSDGPDITTNNSDPVKSLKQNIANGDNRASSADHGPTGGKASTSNESAVKPANRSISPIRSSYAPSTGTTTKTNTGDNTNKSLDGKKTSAVAAPVNRIVGGNSVGKSAACPTAEDSKPSSTQSSANISKAESLPPNNPPRAKITSNNAEGLVKCQNKSSNNSNTGVTKKMSMVHAKIKMFEADGNLK